jgi:class 3 adenylate cyclase/tetratricopeptide (TPR) repeat protein
MTCPRCQHENPSGSNFCLGCGTRLGLQCASCGSELPPGSRFCNKCGYAVTAPGASERPFTSPDTYTPKHLAEKILTSKSALEGERKQVTVLFADLKGSMELLADRDPEEARKLLDPALERMMEAVHRYEGTVNQVMGDGIMALFGAPVALEDHAVRACYAALDMQRALRSYGDEVWRAHGVDVKIRVGLNSGEVVVRAIGSDLRMDYTAVGQTTHLAARMEQLATPGASLLTAETLRLAEGYIEVKPRPPVPVKGVDLPVEVYELAGAGVRRSRVHAAAARGLTRFIGRDQELERLRQALGEAATGHGQIVAIVGEPGVGKSRLVWEVTHSHRTHGWVIVQASSVSYGKSRPYLPVIELLKGYFAIGDHDVERTIREKVVGKLLTLDEALRVTVPAFLALLDVPVDDTKWSILDPAERRRQTLEAVKRLLVGETHRQPLLIVFEDLHWIDSETQVLLDGLVESLPATRCILLVNYRPEYRHGWGSKTYYLQLRLDALPAGSAETLLSVLLGNHPSLDDLRRLLLDRTEGNPFFLEESVRDLAEGGALLGELGGYRAAGALERVDVPASVQAVLAARIDRLPSEDKALLQTAAVVGKDVPMALLHAVAERPDSDVAAAIARLQAAEFLYETATEPTAEYTFKHALTHEVAYGSLLQARRRRLHAQLVAAMERLYEGRLAERVEQLAHHALKGELWIQAVSYLRQAGVKAAQRSAHREAVTYFDHALVALQHVSESEPILEQAIDIRFELRNSLVPLAEYGRIHACLREAEQVAHILRDNHRLAWVYSYLGQDEVLADPEESVVFNERAVRLANDIDDAGLRAVTTHHLGQAYALLGRYRKAADLFRQNVHMLQGPLLHERFGHASVRSVSSGVWLAVSLQYLGDFDDALAAGADAMNIAMAADRPMSLVMAHAGLGLTYLGKGEAARSIALLERGMAIAETAHIVDWYRPTVSGLALAYARLGRHAESRSLLGRIPTSRRAGALIREAEAYFCLTQVDRARELADETLRLASAKKERGNQASALYLLGEIAACRGDHELKTGEGHYLASLAVATELGMRPLIAHCHLGLGTLYRRTGDHAKADEHLTTAARMYREMGMSFWLEKADAELRGVER